VRIAVLAPYYVPAYKAGGPIPGIRGAVASLTGQDVAVLTSDRDLGDQGSFPAAYRGTVIIDAASVTYLPPLSCRSVRQWWAAMTSVRHSDAAYFNSLMSKPFSALPIVLLALSGYRGRVAISPRNELSMSALTVGRVHQTRAWIGVLRTLRWYRRIGRPGCGNVVWVASSTQERADIVVAFPRAIVIVVPEVLRPSGVPVAPRPARSQGLRLISVGRIAPVKGTQDLMRALVRLRVPATLDLVGLAEDESYAASVRRVAANLPDHVTVNWVGAVSPEEVEMRLADAHLFVLLTRGENFCHAIGEALRAGCPVVISDQTPWTFVGAEGAGVVLDVRQCQDPDVVGAALEGVAGLSDEPWLAMSRQAGRSLRMHAADDTRVSLLAALVGPRD